MTQSNSNVITVQLEGLDAQGIKVGKVIIRLEGQVTDASLTSRFGFAKWLFSSIAPTYKKVIENFLGLNDEPKVRPNDEYEDGEPGWQGDLDPEAKPSEPGHICESNYCLSASMPGFLYCKECQSVHFPYEKASQ
jgi:hypothetical protein